MPDNPQDRIRGEIEAFLKRMTGAAPQPAPPQPPPPPRKKREPGRRKPKSQEPAVPPPPPTRRRETISEHVQQHLGSLELGDDSRLMSVDQADEQMESHLKQAFDHKLGKLAERHLTGGEVSDAAPTPVDLEDKVVPIAQLLATPAQVRNAFILSEILRRPEERW